MDHDLNMMLRTPVAHSPNNSASEHEVTRVKVTSSGASTGCFTKARVSSKVSKRRLKRL